MECGRNLQDMAYRTYENQSAHGCLALEALKQGTLLKSIIFTLSAVIALATSSPAAEPPEAPSSVARLNAPVIEAPVAVSVPKLEGSPIDKRFVGFAFISTSSTFADSYTTLFARQNWLAGKKGVCNAEVDSAYLYGTHPTVGRAYAVASAKSAAAILAAYYLRRHHSKFWSLPLVTNSAVSLGGVTQNMIMCN
jgi:hypothetical protein